MLEKIHFSIIFIKTGYTDLRKGIDGLAAVIQDEYQLNVFDKDTLFLFCGRRNDRIKGLVYDGDGFILLYKRIESGRFQWPRSSEEVKTITPKEFRELLSGFAILQESTIHPASPTYVN
jgi:transposase